jgi:hypothetical protein
MLRSSMKGMSMSQPSGWFQVSPFLFLIAITQSGYGLIAALLAAPFGYLSGIAFGKTVLISIICGLFVIVLRTWYLITR